MRLRKAAIAAILWLTLLAGCARPISESPPAPVVRCYDVALGEWSPAMDLRADTTFIIPPRAVALGPKPSTSQRFQGWFSMTPAPGVRGTLHRHRAWMPEGERPMLRLMWTTGFSGVEAVVAPDGRGNLRGIARTRWDMERQQQEAEIVLTQRS